MIGTLLVALAAASWGTWAWFLRSSERHAALPSTAQAALAFGVLAVVVSPLALREGRGRAPRGARAWGWLVALGLIDALSVGTYFAALQLGTVAIAVLTHYLAPVLVTAAAPLLLGEARDPRGPVALGVSLGGLVLVLQPWSGLADTALLSAALGTASAFFYATMVLVTKRLGAAFGPAEVLGWHLGVSALLLALVVPVTAWSALTAPAFGWLALGGVIPGALGGLAFVEGLRRIPAARASLLTLIEPVVAVTVGAVAFGEPLGASAWLGGALVLGSAAWTMAPRR